MNVIMPTAMSSIHEDAELKECASKTAVNGMKILRLLKDDDYVIMNCKAIMSVCRGTGEGAEDMIEVSLNSDTPSPQCLSYIPTSKISTVLYILPASVLESILRQL
jgi:hypothetical protein